MGSEMCIRDSSVGGAGGHGHGMKWRHSPLTTGTFRSVALLGQEVQGQIHLIPLQFDHAVLGGAAAADPGFQCFQQGLEPGGVPFQA